MTQAARGRRATPTELLQWRSRLSEWRKPNAFALTVRAMRRLHGDHVLDQPGSPFREAFLAEICATSMGADYVRLGADPPDFELMFERRIEPFEVVEVQTPGRRRGAELKTERQLPPNERLKPRHIPADHWTSASAVLDQLRDTVTRKAAKRYDRRTALVVYLNVWPVADEKSLRCGIAAAISPALRHFREIWLWDNGELGRFSA